MRMRCRPDRTSGQPYSMGSLTDGPGPGPGPGVMSCWVVRYMLRATSAVGMQGHLRNCSSQRCERGGRGAGGGGVAPGHTTPPERRPLGRIRGSGKAATAAERQSGQQAQRGSQSVQAKGLGEDADGPLVEELRGSVLVEERRREA